MSFIRAVGKSRETAFLRLYDEHHGPLFRFAYRLTGSVADAEDIVQECFLELLRPECGFDASRTPLRTYLFGVVRHQAWKRLRGRGDPPADAENPIDPQSPEVETARLELEQAVARAIQRLPEMQRDVLILVHYEQMSLAEIAQVLDIEIAAVKSRLQRARAGLKQELAAYAPALEQKP